MALSKERIEQIADLYLRHKLEETDHEPSQAFVTLQSFLEKHGYIRLTPENITAEILAEVRQLGLTVPEAAEFAQLVIDTAYTKVTAKLKKLMS